VVTLLDVVSRSQSYSHVTAKVLFIAFARGYVLADVCMSVYLSVCWQLYVKTTDGIFMKI